MAQSNIIATFNNVAKNLYDSSAAASAIPTTFKILWPQAKSEEDSQALLAIMADVIVKQANRLDYVELNPGLFERYDPARGNRNLASHIQGNTQALKQMMDVYTEKLGNRAAPQTLIDGLNNASLEVINAFSTYRDRSYLSEENVAALTSVAAYMTESAASFVTKPPSLGKKAVLGIK